MPASRFVFDNLSFTPAASPVPEPATHLLWLAGAVVLGGLAKRSQRQV
ncbi:PEP-CTERM sorting domain-containing protein [Aquabacterium sp.]|nr:PEP-CTERM sorting domain-containing protein [Aquabacterium sp.]MDI1348195.1 PEP-CTERM sorting domain-containing protein [Aquabacterium sp.]